MLSVIHLFLRCQLRALHGSPALNTSFLPPEVLHLPYHFMHIFDRKNIAVMFAFFFLLYHKLKKSWKQNKTHTLKKKQPTESLWVWKSEWLLLILINLYIQHQSIYVWQRRKSIPKPLEGNNNKIKCKPVKKYMYMCVSWQMKMGLESIVGGL